MTCNFNYLFDNELFKVTASHVHCKCGIISETCWIASLLLHITNSIAGLPLVQTQETDHSHCCRWVHQPANLPRHLKGLGPTSREVVYIP